MLTEEQFRELASRFPVVNQLDPDEQSRIRQSGTRSTVPSSAVLFNAGDACEGFLMLLDGVVKVSQSADDGREILLYRVYPGDSCTLSMSCLMGSAPYPARGRSEGNLSAVMLPADVFFQLVARSDAFREFAFCSLGDRVCSLMAIIEEIAFQKLDSRLAMKLLDRDEPITVTHRALAAELGTSREVVTRLLKLFEEKHALELSRGQITITNRDTMRQLAGLAVAPESS